MKNRQRTLHLTQLSLLIAIELVVGLTPLSFITVPPVSITVLHIPVIIGAILLGPTDGALLGVVMGCISIFRATTAATSPVDMAFSPFLSGNPLGSLLVAMVGRVLLGIVAALLFRLFIKLKVPQTVSIALAAVLASLVHTVVVLGLLAVCFADLGVGLMAILLTIVSLNGSLEIIDAGVVATAVCKPVLAYLHRHN